MLVVNTIIHRIFMEIELNSARRDPFALDPLHGHCDVMYVRTGNTSFSSSQPFQRIRLSLVKKSKCLSKVTGKRTCRDAEISSANPVSRLQNISRKNARARGQRKGLPSRLVKPFLKKEEKPIVCFAVQYSSVVFASLLKMHIVDIHPRRPRGSQSGR